MLYPVSLFLHLPRSHSHRSIVANQKLNSNSSQFQPTELMSSLLGSQELGTQKLVMHVMY